MSALQKLKAYFGMVPADDLDDYDAVEDDGYRRGYRPEYDDDYDYAPASGRRRYRDEPADEVDDLSPVSRGPVRPSWSNETATRGALAMETQREPVARLRPTPEPPMQSSPQAGYPLGRIVTLHPNSYHEARVIGERYREGSPVIINLTELDDADAKRLVDFAAGLAFALRGSMDKVTNKVFLISPPNVDPTAEDKKRMAEGGFLTRR
ncbi:cell division inhibitor SepF [Herbihabitans rhizosphaerae]|uniref:Cell division protein SepF n=1 Tax=Herbihabitans rhizosphaerae TaxID=1872711 RepID=A0A4Q7KHP6_9PSEU|nr:cell division protein SepF [Herbihabitans rhizosphaerae]RZS34813.1 cell division inhibitor SepF [Herbihabitans rhizosphaerae]